MSIHSRISCIVLLSLAACSYSGIKPIGKDTYMEARTKSANSSGGEALADLYEDAGKFCSDQGLTIVPVHEQTQDGSFGHYASATLEFRCVPENDRENKRPNLGIAPTTVINVH